MRTFRLKNGTEEAKGLVATIVLALEKLMETDPLGFFELVKLCRDRDHKPFGNATDRLRDLGLWPIHDSIRNVVLSAVTGDDLDMALGSPVMREENDDASDL